MRLLSPSPKASSKGFPQQDALNVILKTLIEVQLDPLGSDQPLIS